MNLSKEDKKFLELYSDSEYQKPSVTVDAVIFRLKDNESKNYRKLPEKKLQVFLTKRQYSPFKDTFAVVGTFIDLNYELGETMKKCVKNKVNLSNFYSEQLFTFGEKSRDPRTRVISCSYLILTNQEEQLENGEWLNINISENILSKKQEDNGYSIVKEVKIVLSNENLTLENKLIVSVTKNNLEEIKKVEIAQNSLAFDHIKIIYYALERLKNKLEYTDIIFNLIPKEFSLTELKNCYETILGEKLLDANFRRKTAKLVKPTANYITGKGHRSSQLFTHNPLWETVNLD